MSSDSRTDRDDSGALGGEAAAPRGSLRERMRRNPATRLPWRAGVFVLGLLCIAAGGALVVLPGPLTIPPIVLGVWIWSTEFEWAHRFWAPVQKQGAEAWEHAKRHPVADGLGTAAGLVLAGVLIWAFVHYDLMARAKDLVGL